MATGELLDDLSPRPFQTGTSYVPLIQNDLVPLCVFKGLAVSHLR